MLVEKQGTLIDPQVLATAAGSGKPKKLALTACVRKLLTILNSMVRSGKPWSPLRSPLDNKDSCFAIVRGVGGFVDTAGGESYSRANSGHSVRGKRPIFG